MDNLNYTFNKSSAIQIQVHLEKCSASFIPPLKETVNLSNYAEKIFTKAKRFECWNNNQLVGLVAAYINLETKIAYITNVSVEENYKGQGIAKQILNNCFLYCEQQALENIDLEVHQENNIAINLYLQKGFRKFEIRENSNTLMLRKTINND